MNKNIIIVGGGTAGWLTALFVKKFYPEYNVNLVESKEIGILGAGEGTVPGFTTFLNRIDVNVFDVIKNAKGTFKNGIVFEDWNGDGKAYGHIFRPWAEGLSDFSVPGRFDLGCITHHYHHLIANDLSFNDNLLTHKATFNNKSPYIVRAEKVNGEDLRVSYKAQMAFALHFDARLLADYLKNVGIERGIKLFDDKLKQLNTDEKGFITSIDFESGMNLKCKFVYDCTGFHRQIIGKFYKSNWISYDAHLPCRSAIPFFPNTDSFIPPYTLAKALKYGWMWKIPLQHRYGAGYVFDSNMISDDQAKKELDDLMGYEVQSPKTFRFNPGSYDRAWIKNCMAIGLSAGFIEPLEATSIWVSYAQLEESLKYFITAEDQEALEPLRNQFNEVHNNNNERVLDFIYLHYMTKRKDTPFWKNFRKNNKPTKSIQRFLERIKEGPMTVTTVEHMNHQKYHTMKWMADSYIEISHGLGLLDKKYSEFYSSNYILSPNFAEYSVKMNNTVNQMVDHKQFLEIFDLYNP